MLHEFGQHLVAPRLQILEIFRVIGAKPHHHDKVADLGGEVGGHKVAIFQQTLQKFATEFRQKIANFHQRILSMLKHSVLPPNFSRNVFTPI